MDFVNKNVSIFFKAVVAIIVFMIFIRILPWLAIGGMAIWIITKSVKYFKNRKNSNNFDKEKIKKPNIAYDRNDSFDFSKKKVVDVDYKEV